MDLIKNGKLLRDARKNKGMTQKQVADILGILPKTVSKWENGRGFPDVSVISSLSDILGISERSILTGALVKNELESGNMKKMKFYVCSHCGNIMQSTGESRVICCGKTVEPLLSKQPDEAHSISISEIEDEFYVEINHEMRKEHFISFLACIGFDRVLTVRMYPEQDSAIRLPRMRRGKIYYYCSQHGLFEYKCP